jgi:hypothetical protein
MPTTIFDSSLITQRNRNKTIANSFISRIQNPSPVNGSAPLLGITEQSLINSVINGQSTYYRKTNNGCTSVNLGCPCAVQSNTVIDEGILPGSVTNITYQYGSLIISWDAPLIGTMPFTYLVELQSTNPIYNVSAITLNTSYTFINSQLQPGVGYKIAVIPSNIAGTGPTSYYGGEVPVEVIGIFEAPNITVSSFSVDTCTLGFSFPTSGSGFTITSIITDPVLPSGWSIQSFSNTQIVLLNSGSNPASIPDTRFIFSGSLGQTTNSSNLVAGIQTTGSGSLDYWATSMGNGTVVKTIRDNIGNIYVIGIYGISPGSFTINNYLSTTDGTINITPYGTFPTTSTRTIFIIKYDSLGQVIWATNYVYTSGFLGDACVDSNNNLYITGTYTAMNLQFNSKKDVTLGTINVELYGTLSGSITRTNVYIVKYDINGIAQWATSVITNGNSVNSRGASISNGYLYLLCDSSTTNGLVLNSWDNTTLNVINTVEFANINKVSNTFDSFIIKYNLSGTVISANQTLNSSGARSDTALSISSDGTNIYVLLFSSGIVAPLPNIIRVNNFSNNIVGGTLVFNTGSIIISLSTNSQYIVKFDSSDIAIGYTLIISSTANGRIINDSDGNLYLSGNAIITPSLIFYNSDGTQYGTLPSSASGVINSYLIKYDTNGFVEWATVINGTSNSNILSITEKSGFVYCIGSYSSDPININNYKDVTSNSINVELYGTLAKTVNTNNYFILKYDTGNTDITNGGKAQWAIRLDGTTVQNPSGSITTDTSGKIYAVGAFDLSSLAITSFNTTQDGVIYVNPYATLSNNAGTSNIFVIKMNNNGNFT